MSKIKIAFCGASFCAEIQDRLYPSWPYRIAQEFNAKIISNGLVGLALFHSYKDFLKIVDVADYTVFCITSADKLANRSAFPIQYLGKDQKTGLFEHAELAIMPKFVGWPGPADEDVADELIDIPSNAEIYEAKGAGMPEEYILKLVSIQRKAHKANPDKVKICEAANAYYESLVNFEYHDFVQNCIIRELDELMIKKNKKCIWFPCFETSILQYIPKSGPIADTPLMTISYNEYNKTNMSKKEILDEMKYDERINHLNEKNNKILSNIVINIINNNNFEPKKIIMGDYFS